MATAETPARETATPEPSLEQILADCRRRFNVDEYHQMAEAGILRREDHVELIEGDILWKHGERARPRGGEVFGMSPIGSRHAACVDRLTRLFSDGFRERALVRVQGPIRIGVRSEPEPDLMLLRPIAGGYAAAHPEPSDVFLLVEVMDSSAARDRSLKLQLYARSGVPEVWLVDLNRERIEVYRRPAGEAYSETRELPRGESLAPEAFPDVVLGADAILG